MNCPKCKSPMRTLTVDGIEVDQCTSCQGLWFDILEDEKLRARAGQVDTGNARTGAQHNKTDRINCPVCPNTPLLRMVDPHQSHIWFESCPSCYGRFFDAGEFRDLGTRSLGDVLKGLFAKERK